MRTLIYTFALVASFTLSGCPDHDQHASIEQMNEGIKAAQLNSFAAATKHLKEATRLYPDNHQAWYTLGQIYSDQKKWEEAVTVLNEAVRIKGSDPMYQMLAGIAHYQQGNRALAATHLERAVQLEDRLARAHDYLGRVYEDNDEPEKAATEWSRAAMLDPTAGAPLVRLGRLYLMWDMVPQAIQVLEQGADFVLGEDRTNVYYYLGLAYDARQEWDKSIEAYTNSIEAEKSNLDAKFQRGLAYAQKGDKSKARADLQEYVKSAAESSYNKQEANKALMTLIAD
jgi:tetratricopeptide (TPR) repeat protein